MLLTSPATTLETMTNSIQYNSWVDLREIVRDIDKIEVRLIRKFTTYVSSEESIDLELLWTHMQSSVLSPGNGVRITELASIWILKYMEEKRSKGCKTVANSLYSIQHVFRRWGIVIDPATDKLVNGFKAKERKITATRQIQTVKKKASQYDDLKGVLPSMIAWLGNATDDELVKTVRFILTSPDFSENVKDSVRPIAGMDKVTRLILCMKARSMLAIGAVTGMRGVGFFRLSVADVKVVANGEGLLYNYSSRKGGAGHSDLMSKVTRVVHHKNPEEDANATYYQFLSILPRGTTYPFQFGRVSRGSTRQAERNHFASLRNQIVGYIEVAAVACGLSAGIGFKKIHSLRSWCTSALAEGGAGKQDRISHLGWASGDVEAEHYLGAEIAAMALPSPFIASKRLNQRCDFGNASKELEPAPPMWAFMGNIPGKDSMTFGEKVCYIASAAGTSPSRLPHVVVDPSFSAAVKAANVNGIEKISMGDTYTMLTKRVREQDIELQELRAKVARLESDPDVRHDTVQAGVDRLKAIFDEHLETSATDKFFPNICKRVVVGHVVSILDMHATEKGIMGLDLSKDTFGRKLIAVLRMASCAEILVTTPNTRGSRSWFTWTKNASAEFKIFHGGLKSNWQEIRAKIGPKK